MKKIIIVFALILSLFIVSGCNENNEQTNNNEKSSTQNENSNKTGQMVCTKSENVDGLDTNLKVTLDYTEGTIKKIKNETQIKVSEQNKTFYTQIYQGLEDIYININGINVTTQTGTNTVTSILEIDYANLDVEAVKKKMEQLGEDQNDGEVVVSQEGLDLENYKKEFLEDYDCTENNS